MQKGDRVKHIKSDTKTNTRRARISSETRWYQRLNNGVVLEVSKTGKTAWVEFRDANGKRIITSQYLISNLVKIGKPA